MALLKQAELNLQTRRTDKKRRRRWEKERELIQLPHPSKTWTSYGAVVEAYVIQTFTGRIDTFFRIGTHQMRFGSPSFVPYFPAKASLDLQVLLEDAIAWSERGLAHEADKTPAYRWKLAGTAMEIAAAKRSAPTPESTGTFSVGRLIDSTYVCRTAGGGTSFFFSISLDLKKSQNSLEYESFFASTDLFPALSLLDLLHRKFVPALKK